MVARAVLRWKFLEINAYMKVEKGFQIMKFYLNPFKEYTATLPSKDKCNIENSFMFVIFSSLISDYLPIIL
jgi:hypothetical protein